MKTKNYLFIIFFFTLFSLNSCIKNCLDSGFMFRIRLELETSKSGLLILKYNSKNSKNLVAKSEIVKIEESQFVEFCLEEEPLEFKIYFIESVEKVDLKVFSVLLENTSRQMFIEQEMFYLYFKNNQNVQYNKDTNTYVFNPHKVGEKNSYLGSRESLKKRLAKRLKL
ncbi:hypothetical protein [Winogradskyella algicola]|uniref:hypothetical protein n=1 Tax=Winogradskyella algicola TaxID=2575815 RepID=UPI001107A9B7|nr:hypothetical protein [Winogradskyella algicola]